MLPFYNISGAYVDAIQCLKKLSLKKESDKHSVPNWKLVSLSDPSSAFLIKEKDSLVQIIHLIGYN